jgi:uncharacterized protein (UPF0147 family)
MAKPVPGFTKNLEDAVTYFRPILQRLSIRQESTMGTPVFLASFPHLWPLDNLGRWVITVLKTNLVDSKAKFISQYHKKTEIMECYIILDTAFFVDSKVPNEIRKAVAVHEFCHFLALLYASISTTEEILRERLRERLSKIIDELTNEQVIKLYQLLNKMRPFGDNFSDFEQTKDDHFRLNCENLDLSYSDLFRNFLLSRQMFDEFFIKEDRERFFDLLKDGKTQEALDIYIEITKTIAKEKWLPDNFAISQAIDILMKFYLVELK